MKIFEAGYTIATHDTASQYTSATSEVSHPCPLMACMMAVACANASFEESCRTNEYAGSGCLILHDGYMEKMENGKKDLATYWSYSFYNGTKIKEEHRNPELVQKILLKKESVAN